MVRPSHFYLTAAGAVRIREKVDLAEFDVGLISLDQRLKTDGTTTQMLEYLRYSLPVLASCNPGNEPAPLLRDSQAGFCSLTGEDDLLHQNALILCEPERRKQMGENSRLVRGYLIFSRNEIYFLSKSNALAFRVLFVTQPPGQILKANVRRKRFARQASFSYVFRLLN